MDSRETGTLPCGDSDGTSVPARELWQRYRRSRNPETRNELVSRYYAIVKRTVDRILPELPECVGRDELMGAGALGLMQAIEKFDHRPGVKFETYAVPRVRGAILDELRNCDWMPRPLRAKAHKVRDAYSALSHTLGRIPTDEEVAEDLGLSDADFTIIARHAASPASCSIHTGMSNSSDDDLRTIDILRDERAVNPADAIERREIRQMVLNLVRSLPTTDRLIVMLYYYDRLTMKQIGQIINISESRICQVHSDLINRLQRRLSRRKDELAAHV